MLTSVLQVLIISYLAELKIMGLTTVINRPAHTQELFKSHPVDIDQTFVTFVNWPERFHSTFTT